MLNNKTHFALQSEYERYRPFMTLVNLVSQQKVFSTRNWEYGWVWNVLNELCEGGLINKKPNVVDIGCGISPFPILLSMFDVPVVGMDNNVYELPIQKNREIGLLPRYFMYDLTTLHSEDYEIEGFDFVLFISVAEHIDKVGLNYAFRNMWRMLKPGGYIIATIDYFFGTKPYQQIDDYIRTVNIQEEIFDTFTCPVIVNNTLFDIVITDKDNELRDKFGYCGKPGFDDNKLLRDSRFLKANQVDNNGRLLYYIGDKAHPKAKEILTSYGLVLRKI